jgi:hypothetical protein
MASKIQENKNTPNINFIAFQKQLLGITGEIKEHNKKSPLKKMLGRNKESNHVDGSIIGFAAAGNSEVKKLVSKLNKEPTDSTSRVQLVNAVINHSKDHHLDTHRALMLQAAVPIYLGDITPVFVQVSIVTYKTYLEKLQNVHKQNMMAIKSSVLKNVNMSGINVNDEAGDENLKNSEGILTEINVGESLVGQVDDLLKAMQNRPMSTTLSREELEEVTADGKAAASFFGGGEDENSQQKENVVIGKTVQVIEAIKQVPLLQGAGLELAQAMGRIDSKLTFPLVMEGRLYMQGLKYHLLRIESGDKLARENMAPTFNQAVVAYRRAIKLVSKTNPKKGDLPVLTEFANLTQYGFVHRDLMRFTKDGVKHLMKLGKDTIDAAVTVDQSFMPLQKRVESAINQLERAEEEEVYDDD